jgi:hypothetical protein
MTGAEHSAVEGLGAISQLGLAGAIVLAVLSGVAFVLREMRKMKGAISSPTPAPEVPPRRRAISSPGFDADASGAHNLDPWSVMLSKLESIDRRLDGHEASVKEVDNKVDGVAIQLAGIAAEMKWLRRAVNGGGKIPDSTITDFQGTGRRR